MSFDSSQYVLTGGSNNPDKQASKDWANGLLADLEAGMGTVIHGNQYGIVADGVTNDGPAVLAAIAAANALAGGNLIGYGTATPVVELPFGSGKIYMGAHTITLSNATHLRGQGSGEFGGLATALQWDAGVNGIEIEAPNCRLEGFAILGGYVAGVTAEGEFHGIKSHWKFTHRELFIASWQGDCVHAVVSSGSGGDTEGNANNIWGEKSVCAGGRVGVYLAGSDTNAGNFLGFICNYNRQAGVIDTSFLSNLWLGPHATDNGISGTAGIPVTACYDSGYNYYCVYGEEVWAAANPPSGTTDDNQGWRYWRASGGAAASAPQWVPGLSCRGGGHYIIGGPGTIVGLYSEQGSPPSQFGQGCLVVGGNGEIDDLTNYVRANSAEGAVQIGKKLLVSGTFNAVDGDFRFASTTADATVNIQSSTNSVITFMDGDGTPYTNIFGSVAFQRVYYDNYYAAGAHGFRIDHTDVAEINPAGIYLYAGKTLTVNGQQVVSAQGAAVADAAALTSVNGTNAVAAPTQAEFNALVAEFNKLRTDVGAVRTPLNSLLGRVRATTGHGLIAT